MAIIIFLIITFFKGTNTLIEIGDTKFVETGKKTYYDYINIFIRSNKQVSPETINWIEFVKWQDN